MCPSSRIALRGSRREPPGTFLKMKELGISWSEEVSFRVSEVKEALWGLTAFAQACMCWGAIYFSFGVWLDGHFSEGEAIAIRVAFLVLSALVVVAQFGRKEGLAYGGRVAAIGVLCFVGGLVLLLSSLDSSTSSNGNGKVPLIEIDLSSIGAVDVLIGAVARTDPLARAEKPHRGKGQVGQKVSRKGKEKKELTVPGSLPGQVPAPPSIPSVGGGEVADPAQVAPRHPPDLPSGEASEPEVKPEPGPEEVPGDEPEEGGAPDEEESEEGAEPEEGEEPDSEEDPRPERDSGVEGQLVA
jgi:hypothetical protein